MSGIYYFWDNKKNKIVYIGKSINVKMRIKDHLKPSRNKQQIDRVIKSEPERYEYGVLMYCDVNDLDDNERLMIKKYSPKFNFTEGGDSGLKSEVTKKRMSKAQMGHYVSNETKKILSEKRKEYYKTHDVWNKGKKCPQISKFNSGEKHWNYGKNIPIETSIKISQKSNSSGYFRVHKKQRKDCSRGYTWVYSYYDNNNKRREISSVDIRKLEKKVKDKKLPWIKIS